MDVEGLMSTAQALIAVWGMRVIGALVVLIVGMVVARTIRAGARKAMKRAEIDATLIPFLSNMIYYLVVAFVLLAVLRLFGIETTSFIAVLGAAGLAVGLALQGTLSNFAAGVMLLIFRPFGVGDYIDAGGTAGTVVAIGLFSTELKSPDNVKIIVSNSAVYGSVIKNFSAHETRRIDLVMGLSYDDDLQKAKETIERVLGADARVLADPAAVVAVSELADSSVNFVVRPWCKAGDYWALRFDLTRALKEQLEAAGCSIPYPQRDVHMHEVSGAAAQ